jgi:hypothetical protein
VCDPRSFEGYSAEASGNVGPGSAGVSSSPDIELGVGVNFPFKPGISVTLCTSTVVAVTVDGMDVTSNYVPGLADEGLMENYPTYLPPDPPVYDPSQPGYDPTLPLPSNPWKPPNQGPDWL